MMGTLESKILRLYPILSSHKAEEEEEEKQTEALLTQEAFGSVLAVVELDFLFP